MLVIEPDPLRPSADRVEDPTMRGGAIKVWRAHRPRCAGRLPTLRSPTISRAPVPTPERASARSSRKTNVARIQIRTSQHACPVFTRHRNSSSFRFVSRVLRRRAATYAQGHRRNTTAGGYGPGAVGIAYVSQSSLRPVTAFFSGSSICWPR
jgi:hypothetical protein